MAFMDWENYFVFDPKILEIFLLVYDDIVSILNFKFVTRCSSSQVCCFADSRVGDSGSLQCCSTSVISSEDQVYQNT